MAVSTKASTAPPPGSSNPICPPPSSTTSPSMKTCPSITSTAARRITTASAAPRAPRTRSLTNADCFVTNGGDGFYSRVDPKDPNTIYAASQNAGIVRFDRRTGERVSIQPQPAKGDPAAALELGRAVHDQPALQHPPLHRLAEALSQRRSRRFLGRRQPRPHAPIWTAISCP